MKTKAICIIFFAMSAVLALGQARKPILMVVPADNWCVRNGYFVTHKGQEKTVDVPDYEKAVLRDDNCIQVITKINTLMADRGFPLKDFSAAVKFMESNRVMDAVGQLKSGTKMVETPLDVLKRMSHADIVIDLNWTVNTVGPRRSITYSLAAIDAYTNKQIAGFQGTGNPSFAASTPVLLEEAVIGGIDGFTSQLQAHFDDMVANGREVLLEIRLVSNKQGINLNTEYKGTELTDIIDDWVAANTVNHRYNLSQGSKNFLRFEQVRIPLFNADGVPTDTRRWARELVKHLTSQYAIPCRVDIRGLGMAVVMIGEK